MKRNMKNKNSSPQKNQPVADRKPQKEEEEEPSL